MRRTVKERLGDTVTLDNGERYRAEDADGRGEISMMKPKDVVDVSGGLSDATMRRWGGKEIKVRRV